MIVQGVPLREVFETIADLCENGGGVELAKHFKNNMIPKIMKEKQLVYKIIDLFEKHPEMFLLFPNQILEQIKGLQNNDKVSLK